MTNICYIDRVTKQEETERVYGGAFIRLLYAKKWFLRPLAWVLLPLVARLTCFSQLYGALQKTKMSRFKILPFIRKFQVNPEEFADPVDSFCSFNDFFIRKLRPEARPIASGHDVAILPADGRYLVFPNLSLVSSFFVKGKRVFLDELLQDATLTQKYAQGSMVIARLCPSDYHRFHFPCNGIAEQATVIPGALFSVNPLALKAKKDVFIQNKRVMTNVHTKNFGHILYIEVGATYVGTIHQTFIPGEPYAKGDEKGYFSFGGSSLILLFEPGFIAFDQDLLDASTRGCEVRGLLGQSLGRALSL